MILNFDRGFGQTPEQMVQSLMESTQMALDTMERKLSDAGIDISSDGGSISLLDMVYPIGAIYISVSNVSPESFLGGTWEQIKDQFILAAGDKYEAGSTGGSEDAVVVQHSHKPSSTSELFVTSEEGEANNTRVAYASSGNRWVDGQTSQSHFHHRYSTEAVGEDGTGKNMPPYVTAYVWKRTA